jgi:DNA polymerase III epsilon subunit-like protein
VNRQDIIFLDFETTGINPYTCQPTELAAVVIDGRRLTIREDSVFTSLIKPEFDEDKCAALNLDPMSEEAARKTGISLDMLKDAPEPSVVWENFKQYVKRWNPSGSKWNAPIKAGFNIVNYDAVIIDRLCGGHFHVLKSSLDFLSKTKAFSNVKIPRLTDPYGFGPWDDKRMEETLFAPRDIIDLMHIVWLYTENNPEITSIGMDAMREYLGIEKDGAHRAEKDVLDGANILINFLTLTRKVAGKTKFKGTMSGKV